MLAFIVWLATVCSSIVVLLGTVPDSVVLDFIVWLATVLVYCSTVRNCRVLACLSISVLSIEEQWSIYREKVKKMEYFTGFLLLLFNCKLSVAIHALLNANASKTQKLYCCQLVTELLTM